MRDQLQPVVQAAVRFDIEVVRFPVGHPEQPAGIIVFTSALIDLQFHAEPAQALAVEHQLGHVIIFVDHGIGKASAVALLAQLFIIIAIHQFVVEQGVALFTSGIIPVIAAPAQGMVTVPNVRFGIKPVSAFIADKRQPLRALPAKTVPLCQYGFFEWECLPAVVTGIGPLHGLFLLRSFQYHTPDQTGYSLSSCSSIITVSAAPDRTTITA